VPCRWAAEMAEWCEEAFEAEAGRARGGKAEGAWRGVVGAEAVCTSVVAMLL
jgi:hypothetical protein